MRALLIPLLTLALVGCATTGAGDDGIAIDTASRGQPMPGANCVVQTGAGSWNVVTPAVVKVGDATGNLRIVCDRPGYRTSEFVYAPTARYSSGSSVGIGLGGIGRHVGLGVGVNVPLGGGSRGAYPPKVTIDMNPQ